MNHIETRVYSEQQYNEIGALEAWNILLDIHNAILYGFVQYRLPEPGRAIDTARADAHVHNIEREWLSEKLKRDFSNEWSGAPPLSEMPPNARYYLHSVLTDAWKNVRESPGSRRTFIPFL